MRGNTVTRKQKFGIAVIVIGALTPVAIDFISYKIQMAKAIAEIDAETEREIIAMNKAKRIVQTKIKNGDYQNRSSTDVENDFRFYRIAARFNG